MSSNLTSSAQQISLTCAGPQDTRMCGREGTDPVGRVQPMGTCFEHHRQIPLQLLWGYWDPLTLSHRSGQLSSKPCQLWDKDSSNNTNSTVKTNTSKKPNPERSFCSLLEQWLSWKTGLWDCPDYIS